MPGGYSARGGQDHFEGVSYATSQNRILPKVPLTSRGGIDLDPLSQVQLGHPFGSEYLFAITASAVRVASPNPDNARSGPGVSRDVGRPACYDEFGECTFTKRRSKSV